MCGLETVLKKEKMRVGRERETGGREREGGRRREVERGRGRDEQKVPGVLQTPYVCKLITPKNGREGRESREERREKGEGRERGWVGRAEGGRDGSYVIIIYVT